MHFFYKSIAQSRMSSNVSEIEDMLVLKRVINILPELDQDTDVGDVLVLIGKGLYR